MPKRKSQSVYDELTAAQAIRAAQWMQEAMGLEDWEVQVHVSSEAPESCHDQVGTYQALRERRVLGHCAADALYKTAAIWLCGKEALATLGHEMCHVLAADLGIGDDTEDRYEFAWTKLGNLAAAAYRAEK